MDFICQGNYLQDVAYGHRLLKITDNYSISIPNVVRTANNSKIVNDYMIICKQLNMIPLSKSVCFKILKECPTVELATEIMEINVNKLYLIVV